MENLTLNITDDAGELHISFAGNLNNDNASDCEKQVLEALKDNKKVILDMSELTHISSMGLMFIMTLQNRIDDIDDGILTLTNVKEEVLSILDVAGFTKFLDIK